MHLIGHLIPAAFKSDSQPPLSRRSSRLTVDLSVLAIFFGLFSFPAVAGHKTIDIGNLKKEVDLPAGGFGETFDMKLVVQQVFNPGMSDKRGCRLQVYMTNTSKVTINLRANVTTYDTQNEVADVNLVPTADLLPGQQVMRLYSCKPAESIEVSRDNLYSWPNVCDINGAEQSPCPVAVHFSSTLGIIEQK